MSGLKWRAISTAPKDGTTILIKAKCGFITTVIWGNACIEFGKSKKWWFSNLEEKFGFWAAEYKLTELDITHWAKID
jgi:hypothetical protein